MVPHYGFDLHFSDNVTPFFLKGTYAIVHVIVLCGIFLYLLI